MDRNTATNHLKHLIDDGKQVIGTSHFSDGVLGGPFVSSNLYVPWRAKAAFILNEVLPEYQQKSLKRLEELNSNHTVTAEDWLAQLQAALDGIEDGLIRLPDSPMEALDADMIIERILENIPEVVSSINDRHAGRNGFDVKDEYDVQDLLQSVCLSIFGDVRDEEAVPSFAGKNSRVDLFLKDESRFIEVKMTRTNLRDKQLGDQLSIDIPQYKMHLGCDKLFCFIYDPQRFIKNQRGLKSDLESIDPDFVRVLIAH
jgi:hypothetical protein